MNIAKGTLKNEVCQGGRVNQITNKDLEPCPFCGEAVEFNRVSTSEGEVFTIECKPCSVVMSDYNRSKGAYMRYDTLGEKWNRFGC